MKEVKILAIESSCDETAAAVVVNGREALSNVISSQIDLHAARDYKKEVIPVPTDRKLKIHMAPGGGYAARIQKR